MQPSQIVVQNRTKCFQMFYDCGELIQKAVCNVTGLISDMYEWIQRMHLVQYFFGILFLFASSVPFF